MRAAKVHASLRICAVSSEPSLLTHTSSESRGTFRQKTRSLAPLNGWTCAVEICHDGMLEDTNSLDAAQLINIKLNPKRYKTPSISSISDYHQSTCFLLLISQLSGCSWSYLISAQFFLLSKLCVSLLFPKLSFFSEFFCQWTNFPSVISVPLSSYSMGSVLLLVLPSFYLVWVAYNPLFITLIIILILSSVSLYYFGLLLISSSLSLVYLGLLTILSSLSLVDL